MLTSRSRDGPEIPAPTRKPVMLPLLHTDPRKPGSLVGKVDYSGNQITVRIDPDGEDSEQCRTVARQGISSLQTIDTRAKAVAVKKLLSTYNDNWRCYGEVQDDGTTKEIAEPILTAGEFERRLTMISVDLTGLDCWTISYDDGGMFGGHLVIVTSFDGEAFEDSDADLFG